jgi:hypothetical protein
MPSPGHPHRVRRPLSQAAAGDQLQKPCQRKKLIFINDLSESGAPLSGQKAPSRRHNPANNSYRQRRGKYPLTIPA